MDSALSIGTDRQDPAGPVDRLVGRYHLLLSFFDKILPTRYYFILREVLQVDSRSCKQYLDYDRKDLNDKENYKYNILNTASRMVCLFTPRGKPTCLHKNLFMERGTQSDRNCCHCRSGVLHLEQEWQLSPVDLLSKGMPWK
jgi:hypothetical protein